MIAVAIRGFALGVLVAEANKAGNVPFSLLVLLALVTIFCRGCDR